MYLFLSSIVTSQFTRNLLRSHNKKHTIDNTLILTMCDLDDFGKISIQRVCSDNNMNAVDDDDMLNLVLYLCYCTSNAFCLGKSLTINMAILWCLESSNENMINTMFIRYIYVVFKRFVTKTHVRSIVLYCLCVLNLSIYHLSTDT